MNDELLSSEEMDELNAELEAESLGHANVPDDVAETPTDELALVHLKHPCRECGGAIVVGERAYECNKCGWRAWRNVLTHDISQAEMEEILRDGQSRVINDFENKKGNEFSARLTFAAPAADDAEDEAGEKKPRRTLELVYAERPVHVVGRCPKCKKQGKEQDVVLRAGNYFCVDNPPQRPGGEKVTRKCDFMLFGEVRGKTLSEAVVKELLAGKQTKFLKGFTSKAGNPFDAALKLTPSGQLDWVFQEKKKKSA
jgi:hypothetical protein